MKRIIVIVVFLTGIYNFSKAQLSPVTVNIPMRDGRFLAADIYFPNNDSLPRPTILIQTPYNKNFYTGTGLPLRVGFSINLSPYNFVIADWRCFHGSAAACTTGMNRGQDGNDCVEWVAQQPWSNGSVGTWGPSALGIIQFQTAKENPPHLTCCVPVVAGMRTSYQRYFPGGVYRTEYVQMLDFLGYGLSVLLLAHPVHDIYWQISEAATFYPAFVGVPVFMIGGWYDHATEEVLESFEGLRTQSPSAVRSQHKLLMGPWTHNHASDAPAQIGQLSYPQAQDVSDSLARNFCDYHLLNASNGWNTRPVVEYFQMGENTWENDSAWNTNGITNYQLHLYSDGSMNLPLSLSPTDSLTFSYDPHDPSPTVGGPVLLIGLDQGPYDQQPVVESRNDILSFATSVLTQDVVLRGRPAAHLRIASDRTDTDFSLRLTDVYPDGRSMLVMDGIRRSRFRDGYGAADTSNLVPGNIYSLDIDFFATTAITFLAGHRIRVDISGSNYPRFDCNLNNGQQQYAAGDTLIAVNTVYMNSTNASYISLPLVNFNDGIDEPEGHSPLVFSPNPCDGHFSVTELQFGKHRKFDLSIYNSLGSEVFTGSLTSSNTSVNASVLVTGIYLVKIVSDRVTYTGILQVIR